MRVSPSSRLPAVTSDKRAIAWIPWCRVWLWVLMWSTIVSGVSPFQRGEKAWASTTSRDGLDLKVLPSASTDDSRGELQFDTKPTGLRTPQPFSGATASTLGGNDGGTALAAGEAVSSGKRGLLFDPAVLEFGESPVCIQTAAKVTVRNTNRCAGKDCSADGVSSRGVSRGSWIGVGGHVEAGGGEDEGWIQVLSVESNSAQFHPASLQPRALPPGGELSFQVLLLPRGVGAVEAVVTVATSEGDVRYKVKGEAVPSEFKIQPIIASCIPAGSTYTRPIMVYNPRDSPTLTITEIFATENFLELATRETSAGASSVAPHASGGWRGARSSRGFPTAFRDAETPDGAAPLQGTVPAANPGWRIAPGEELEVSGLSFQAELPGNFQGYVHIRTDRANMVVPVELDVCRGGVDPTPTEVDFGVLTSPSERRQASVSLFNSGSDPMLILGARVSNPDPRINVGFREGTVIAPGEGMDDAVRLVYSGGQPANNGDDKTTAPDAHVSGKVLIAMNHTVPDLAVAEIEYRAHILHGGVAYQWGHVSFQVRVGHNFPAKDTPPLSPPGITQNIPSSSKQRRRMNGRTLKDTDTEQSGGVSASAGGHKEGAGATMMPAYETRRLDLTNHFPVPMQLLSLTMEDCQDILSVTDIQSSGAASVALPQASWEGISLTFQRTAATAVPVNSSDSGSSADSGDSDSREGRGGDGGSFPSPTSFSSSAPLEPKAAEHSRKPALASRSARTGTGDLSGISEGNLAAKGMGVGGSASGNAISYPTPDQDGHYRGSGSHPVEGSGREGTREAIPSVSMDQRTPEQGRREEMFKIWERETAKRRKDLHRQQHDVADDGDDDTMFREGGGRREGGAGTEFRHPQGEPPFTCTLRAETNASIHQIPIFVFDGSLHYGLLGNDGHWDLSGFHGSGSESVGGGVSGQEFSARGSEVTGVRDERLVASGVAGLPPDSRSTQSSPGTVPEATSDFMAGVGAGVDASPPSTPPLVINLGVLRAGTTGRRRFNVTNVNPVEVVLSAVSGSGGLPFALLRLEEMGPLEHAPQVLTEIGRHIQSRSEQDTATKSGSSDSVNEAIAPRLATSMPPTPASSRRKPDRHTTVSSITARPMSHDLVRETLVDGEVSTREMFRVTKGGGLGRMGWVPRKETAETGEEGQVWRLVPGATAMFEVVATAPEEIAHEGMQFQVRGLLLSTPVEAVPILVTYSVVSGGIFFHGPSVQYTPDNAQESSAINKSTERERGKSKTQNLHKAAGRLTDRFRKEAGRDSQSESAPDAMKDAEVAAIHLGKAFPGNVAVSPVSLRSTVSRAGRVESMESDGPLVRTVLTNRDLPGVSTSPRLEGAENGNVCGVVEIGRLEYDASEGCPDADAWSCLLERIKQSGCGDRGSGCEEGVGGKQKELKDVLSRLVHELHGGPEGVPGDIPADESAAESVPNGNACQGDDSHALTGGSKDSRKAACHQTQSVKGDEVNGNHRLSEARIKLDGRSFRTVGVKSAAAAEELWRRWPEVVQSGMNGFREEVNVRTTFGQTSTSLHVHVSLDIPRLVIGATNEFTFCPSPSEHGRSLRCATAAAAVTPAEAAGAEAVTQQNAAIENPASTDMRIRFPVTQVGASRELYLAIRNPAESPVSIQLAAAEGTSVVWTDRGQETGELGAAVVAVGVDFAAKKTSTAAGDTAPGAAVDAESEAFSSPDESLFAGADAAFHVRLSGFLPVELEAGATSVVGPIKFAPSKQGAFSAHLYLRNSLTHLEPILLEGHAGSGMLSVRLSGLESAGGEGGKTPAVVMPAVPTAAPEAVMLARVRPVEDTKRNVPTVRIEAAAREEMGPKEETVTAEGEDGDNQKGDREDLVARFPVDFRSWARSPPTIEPVIRRWILSNDGTMPLVLHGVGIVTDGFSAAPSRRAGRWPWGWGKREDHVTAGGGCGAGCRDGASGSLGQRFRKVFSRSNAQRLISFLPIPRGGSNAAKEEGARYMLEPAGLSPMFVTTPTLCADGGFQVVAEACADEERWRPQTLQPGERVEVAIGYSAAHCDPVERSLAVFSSAGDTSIRMLASASGGPSAVAACKSARRAAAAAGKGNAARVGGVSGTAGSSAIGAARGSGGREERWTRAWLLIKMAFLAGVLYGGFAVLGAGGPMLQPLLKWVRRLRVQTAACVQAGWRACRDGVAVSVELRASAAVMVSSSSSSLKKNLPSAIAAVRAVAVTCSDSSRAERTGKVPETAISARESRDAVTSCSPSDPASLSSCFAAGNARDLTGQGNQSFAATTDEDALKTPPESGRHGTANGAWETSVGGGTGGAAIMSAPAPAMVAEDLASSTATAVEKLNSPGQASKPNAGSTEECERRRSASPAAEGPRAEKGQRRQDAPPPLVAGSGGRGTAEQRRSFHAQKAGATAALLPAEKRVSPSRGWSMTTGHANQSNVDAGGEAGSTTSVTKRRGHGAVVPGGAMGPSFSLQKKGAGRLGASSGSTAGAAGRNYLPQEGYGNGQKGKRPAGLHFQRPVISRQARVGVGSQQQPVSHQRLNGNHPPTSGGNRNLLQQSSLGAHMSPSASSPASIVGEDFPSLPALSSPATSALSSPHSGTPRQQPQQGYQPPTARGGHRSSSVGSTQPTASGHAGANGGTGYSGRSPGGSASPQGVKPSAVLTTAAAAQTPQQSPTFRATSERGALNHRSPVGVECTAPAPERQSFRQPSTGWGITETIPRSPHGAVHTVANPNVTTSAALGLIGTTSKALSSRSFQASPPLGPIGSNRLCRRGSPLQRSAAAGVSAVGATAAAAAARRPPPGLCPPNKLASPFLPMVRAPADPRDVETEAERSDNLDAFATASAVVAGVLGADDMDDAAPLSPALGVRSSMDRVPAYADGWREFTPGGSAAVASPAAARLDSTFSSPRPSSTLGGRLPGSRHVDYGSSGLSFGADPFGYASVGTGECGGVFSNDTGRSPSVTLGGSRLGGGRPSGASRLGHYMSSPAGVGSSPGVGSGTGLRGGGMPTGAAHGSAEVSAQVHGGSKLSPSASPYFVRRVGPADDEPRAMKTKSEDK